MKNRMFSIVFGLFLIILTCSVQANATNFTIYSGYLPPVTYPDDSGQVQGIAVDVLELIMAKVDNPIDVSQISMIEWPKAMKAVETTPDTILFTAALTPEREFKFKFVGPVSSLNLGLIARKDADIRIRARDDIKNYRIAIINGSASVAMLEAGYGLAKTDLVYVNTNAEQFRLLKDGEVDMITQTDMSTPFLMKDFGLVVEDYEMVHVLSKINLYYLFNKETSDEFILKLQIAMDTMKRSLFDGLANKHLDGSEPIKVQGQ